MILEFHLDRSDHVGSSADGESSVYCANHVLLITAVNYNRPSLLGGWSKDNKLEKDIER